MLKQRFKGHHIAGNKPSIGIGLCLGSERIAEMVCQYGFDFVMVDRLHSHYDKLEATRAIRTLALGGVSSPFARVAANEQGEINEMLDAGAMGIIVPMVESAVEADRAVQSAYYPPIGKRSKGSLAAAFYGQSYYKDINENLNLIVMIETPEAVASADEILSVPGVTGCLIGAGDLSFVLSSQGQSDRFDELVIAAISVGKRRGVTMGIAVSSVNDLEKWWEKGADFFLLSHDLGIFDNALRNYYEMFNCCGQMAR